jgi:hypothetical protein
LYLFDFWRFPACSLAPLFCPPTFKFRTGPTARSPHLPSAASNCPRVAILLEAKGLSSNDTALIHIISTTARQLQSNGCKHCSRMRRVRSRRPCTELATPKGKKQAPQAAAEGAPARQRAHCERCLLRGRR